LILESRSIIEVVELRNRQAVFRDRYYAGRVLEQMIRQLKESQVSLTPINAVLTGQTLSV
jgi:hypothetical protein